MVSKIPYTISFTFCTEETITKKGKCSKKRSFEAIEKQIIEPFKISRVNKFKYT
jgi:hypothetical protein